MADPEKHGRYLLQYRANDLFWGIGIENETYLQFERPVEFTATEIYKNHNPERYSVNYYKTFSSNYQADMKLLYPSPAQFPLYINAHTFQKTDLSGNHATTYEREPKPNPNYSGESVHEFLCRKNPIIFKRKYKVNYLYDGDTVEFMTQRFYKTTVSAVIQELMLEKILYLRALNETLRPTGFLDQHGPILFPPKNAGFAVYHTNKRNVAAFNNGTYHLNFTLITQLDSKSRPINRQQFVDRHRTAIRAIQAVEPLLIAVYGSPDQLSTVAPGYSKASQRCAVSRYIGIGTYDTERMETGKILQRDVTMIRQSKLPYWWYNLYHTISSYTPLEKIGMDINFNKHGNHGIELRFLDSFEEDRLAPLMEFIVHLLDFAHTKNGFKDATTQLVWNNIVVKALKDGHQARLTKNETRFYAELFDLPSIESPITIARLLAILETQLQSRPGPYAKLMLDPPEKNRCLK
jgi:hypothetical protein